MPTIPGGSTCWSGDRNRPTRASFDIDWQTLPGRPRGGVLIPILGRSYGEALESGEIELRYDAAEGSFSACYGEHRLADRSQPLRRNPAESRCAEAGAATSRRAASCSTLAARYRGPHNPPRPQAPAFKARACRDRRRQATLSSVACAPIAPAPASREPSLPCITCWSGSITGSRIGALPAARSIIGDFSTSMRWPGLRVEDRGTFDAIHRLVRRLIGDSSLQGLRLDHIDGLRDPHQYFRRLQRLIDAQRAAGKRGVLRHRRKDSRRGRTRCRALPASPARPATNGSISSRASCSTTAASARSSAPGSEASGDARSLSSHSASRPSAA